MAVTGFMFLMVVILLLARVPIAFAFGSAVVLANLIFTVPFDAAFTSALNGFSGFSLVALPLFIYLGIVMDKAGLASIVVNYVELVFQRIKAAVPIITVTSCALFGAVSGAGSGAVAAIGPMMIPRAVERGYRRGFITGLVAVSSVLPLLIPPSLSMLIFALAARISVGAAFLTTLVPAILIIAIYVIYISIEVRRGASWVFDGEQGLANFRTRTAAPFATTVWMKRVFGSMPRVVPIAAIPLIVLGTIYGGLASPTEAAALGVWASLFLGVLVYRTFRLKSWWNATLDAASLTGALAFLLFTIQIFSHVVVHEGVPFQIADWLDEAGLGRVVTLLLLNIALLLIGMVMDDLSGAAFAATLLLPIGTAVGLDPLHFAAIVGVNLGIGNVTPPVAPLAFLAAGVGKVRLSEVWGSMGRLLLVANIPVLLLVTYIPDLALWLPHAFGLGR